MYGTDSNIHSTIKGYKYTGYAIITGMSQNRWEINISCHLTS